jgi:NADH:ubiquinone oxidoreductase subunit 4 (subunit M)
MLESVFPNLYLLTVTVTLPLLAALVVWGMGASRLGASRIVAIGSAALPLLILGFAAFRMASETGLQLGDRYDLWPDLGVSLALAVDGLSLPFALLAAALGTLGVTSARNRHETALALLAEATALLLFLSQDLFVFLAAWWLLPLLLYTLITGWGRGRSEYAATKFLVMILTGAALLTVSLIAVYLVGNGNGSMAALWITKPGFPLEFLNHWVLAGILLATWVAAPLFPFHTWLADVFDSAPPSALPLVVGGIQAGGAYAFVRLAMGYFPSYLESWLPWTAALGVLTALYALLAAWGQRSLLRGLAFLAIAIAGMAAVGVAAMPGQSAGQAVFWTLLMVLSATGAGGLLAWLTAEISSRSGPAEVLLARLGFLMPRGAGIWVGIGCVALLLVLIPGVMLLPGLFENRIGLAVGLGIALLGLLGTGGGALRAALLAPATPAQVEGVEDLSSRQLTIAWLSLLLAVVPLFWLILGSRAIAVFASQLSLGFVR